MNKIVYMILFLSVFLNASIIKDVEVFETTDKTLKIEEVKNSKEFKRTRLPIIRHSKKDYFIKIFLDTSKLNEEIKTLEFNNEFNFTEFEKDIEINKLFKHPTINISKDSPDIIYLKVHNDDGYANFNVEVFDKNEFIEEQLWLNKFFGIAYGVIFAAFLYYFALFLFNKNASYIYYSLTQLSMLSILVFLSSRAMENDRILMDIIFFSFFLFSNLFTQHFLNTKEKSPKIHILLNLIIAIYMLNIFFGYAFDYYIFEENLPLSTLLLVYIFAAFSVYKKGDKPVLFYLLGWSLVVFTFLFIEAQFYLSENQLLVKPIFLIHLVTPLESLILAFALSYKMKLLEDEKQEQQHFLSHQSKLASMGEMIGNIAHQWRQPLTHLSYVMMNIKTAFEKDKLSNEYFEKKSKEATEQLEFMSHTIDDFRDFFKMSKKKESFSLKEAINEVINLLSASFSSHKIEVKFDCKKDIEVKSLRREFLQVIFNILNNAKDEFSRKETQNPKIEITLIEENENIIIKISDNAGGIKKEFLNKIFEPYFTTKDKGLGIGLYMSKMIIDKNIGGKLEVENSEQGALFSITLNKDL